MPKLACLALMLVAAAWVPAVHAQEAAPGVSEGSRAAGEALLDSGRAAYRFGNYVQAMRDFEQALARLGRPSIHYDIGDAAARLGDHQRAIDEFQQYLSALPNASNRASVERRIESQQQALNKGKPQPDLTPTAAAQTQAATSAEAPPPTASGAAEGHDAGELWWLWAGIGVAVVGTVVAALIVSSSEAPVQPPLHGDVGPSGTIQTLRVR